MKKLSRACLVTILSLSTLFLMAFSPAILPQSASVAAATPNPQAGQRIDQQMAFTLQREQNALLRQQLHLTRASQFTTRVQELVAKAQAKGVNVDDLVKALADFNTSLTSAQKSHDQAASILNAKNGFDSSGNVTDRQVAHQTLIDGRDNLRQAHLTLVNGMLTLRTVVQDWRIKNKNS